MTRVASTRPARLFAGKTVVDGQFGQGLLFPPVSSWGDNRRRKTAVTNSPMLFPDRNFEKNPFNKFK
jgi:hypothetical protein